MKPRVVIAGFGDTGLLTAIHLGEGFDVVGISPKPCLVSGQELGTRLTRPQQWQHDYLMPYSRYKKLDNTHIVQGLVEHIDSGKQQVTVRTLDQGEQQFEYDALVIASGVQNGFWRDNRMVGLDRIEQQLQQQAGAIDEAATINIIGGGATGVSVASNIKSHYPGKAVTLYFSQDQVLPGYHPRVRQQLTDKLADQGVSLQGGHRAVIPEGFRCDRLTHDPVNWSTGQSASAAGLTLWAVGGQHPNNNFIPAGMLNHWGFVKTDTKLRVAGYDNVFAVGDIAATDPHRSSARNWGYRLLAHNLRAHLQGRDSEMKDYQAPEYRWGSILGVQQDGLNVFQPDGNSFRFPHWSVRSLLFPLAVRRGIYKGVRKRPPPTIRGTAEQPE